jgi:hypothetical protein
MGAPGADASPHATLARLGIVSIDASQLVRRPTAPLAMACRVDVAQYRNPVRL